jgi:hypothetical protein
MAKEKKGESISVYINRDIKELVREKAKKEKKSKSQIINEILINSLIKSPKQEAQAIL